MKRIMNFYEYTLKKNKIFNDKLGIDLIKPECIDKEILENMEVVELSKATDASICPYCLLYNNKNNNYCKDCPIYINEDCCDDAESTYRKALSKCQEKHGNEEVMLIKMIPELNKLVDEFNNSIK